MHIPIFQTRLEKAGELEVRHQDITTMAIAAETIIPFIHDKDKEYLIALYLVHPYKLIGVEVLAIGSSDTATTSMREMLRGALCASASAVIIAHNHPHGSVKPSRADVETTKKFQIAAEQQGIQLVGSLIVNTEGEFHDIMSVPEIKNQTIFRLQGHLKEMKQTSKIDKAIFFLKVGLRMSVMLLSLYFFGQLIHSILSDIEGWKQAHPLIWSFVALFVVVNFQALRWGSTFSVRRFPKVMPYDIADNYSFQGER